MAANVLTKLTGLQSTTCKDEILSSYRDADKIMIPEQYVAKKSLNYTC